MVWAAFSFNGQVGMAFLDGRQNSPKYIETLENHLMPFAENIGGRNCLVILKSCFEATLVLFWDGPRHFEPQSDDKDDARAGSPSPNFRTTPTGGRFVPNVRFNVQLAQYTTDLQWNRVSTLETSGPKAENLLLGHVTYNYACQM
ncbi:hypothetical protein AVEN_9675-1 [Araneus ventricosus]|uniref:Transposable element Tc3 transposase n=1 Tax=Araneus ventricosus TaxID=182803 RepID=A0A4Y2KK38_ARAVE|nr:hypothetical protein AVEN_9675-1 [Araneus ventricosus]